MQNALSPLMTALVDGKLVKHSDIDVKVAVAACISEITRITAPDAPYDDDKMRVCYCLVIFLEGMGIKVIEWLLTLFFYSCAGGI